MLYVNSILHIPFIVETKAMPNLRNNLWVRLTSGKAVGWISAGEQEEDRKRNERYDKHNESSPKHAPYDVPGHTRSTRTVAVRSPRRPLTARLGVEGISQTIANEVEGQCGRQEEEARKHHQPPSHIEQA